MNSLKKGDGGPTFTLWCGSQSLEFSGRGVLVPLLHRAIAEWLKHKCLWDVKARAYNDRSAREKCFENLVGIIWNYSELF